MIDMTHKRTLRRLMLFGIVGGFGTLLNTALLHLLTATAGLHYLISSAIATEAAIISNFFGNHILTFRDSRDPAPAWRKFLTFQAVSMSALVCTLLVLWLLTTLFGIGLLLVWNLIAIGISFLLNFFLNRRFTWTEKAIAEPKARSRLLVLLIAALLLATAASADLLERPELDDEEETHELTVKTEPKGAEIFLNGTSMGTTAGKGELEIEDLPPGPYELVAAKEGYAAVTREFTLSTDTEIVVMLEQLPLPGALHIATVPALAMVLLNNTIVGMTDASGSLELDPLDPGSYLVSITKQGYAPFEKSIAVGEGKTTEITVLLKEVKNGTLTITTTPTATISIDGALAGLARSDGTFIASLAPGTYTILIEKAGYHEATRTATVTADKTTALSAPLLLIEPQNGTLTLSSSPTGAMIEIDGVARGSTPSTLTLDPGTYHVAVRKAGYRQNQTTATIGEGEVKSINLLLAPIAPNSTVNTTNTTGPNTTGPLDPDRTGTGTDLQKNGGRHFMYETATAAFWVTATKPGNITWFVDGMPARTVTGTSDEFTWTPGILYASDIKPALIQVTTADGTTGWDVDVENVVNPYIDGQTGAAEARIHVFTNSRAVQYSLVQAVIENEDGSSATHALSPYVSGHEVDWSGLAAFGYGQSYLVQVIGHDNETGQTDTYTLTTERGHYRTRPASSGGNAGSSGGGGGSSGMRFGSPELVYATFKEPVVALNGTQTLTLDAKNFNGGVRKVAATIRTATGDYRTHELRLASGSEEYGTWSASFAVPDPGKHTLEYVTLWGGHTPDPVKATVRNTSFYADPGGGQNHTLRLVYAVLNASTVTNGSTVLLRTDAQDSAGITSVAARIESNRGEFFIVALERVEGDEEYGTWEGTFNVGSPDTTYSIRSITLTNALGEQQEQQVSGRSVYVKPLPKPKVVSAGITGNAVSPFSREGLAKLMREPLLPTAIGFGLMLLIIAGVIIGARISKKERKVE